MNSTDAAAYLRLLAIKGVGPVSGGRLLEGLRQAGMTPAQVLETLEGRAVLARLLKPDQLQAAENPDPRVQEQALRCEALGVQFLPLTDRDYPVSLRASSKSPPPMLACLGNLSLFGRQGVGFCGSRAASEKGIATAKDIADQLARSDVTIVSGYAAGVDQAAHRAALVAGGTTIVVLPEGILHFQIRRELADVWDWARVLVVSEFSPGAPWSASLAMQRNKTILALSDVMMLIEAGATGGSMAAGLEAIAMGKPLFAPVYDGMPPTAVGNRMLLERGAQSLMKKASTNRANLERVMAALRHPKSTPVSEVSALPLAAVG